MFKQVPVSVLWTKEKFKCMKQIESRITSSVYSTLSKFPEDKTTWNEESWSIVLFFDVPFSLNNPMAAMARFLVEEAPHTRLRKGNKFEVYEAKKVADVEIIGDGQWLETVEPLFS